MDRYIRLRTTVIGIFITLFFVIIAVRAFYIQLIVGPYMAEKASYQYISTRKIIQKRGNIYDKNNITIATTIDGCSIVVYPHRIKNAENVAETLSDAISTDKISIKNKILTAELNKRSFAWIKRQLPGSYKEKISNFMLPGVGIVKEDYRFYPYGNTGTSVLGFVGMDPVGLDGIEYAYNSYLSGREQSYKIFKDALGRVFGFRRKGNSSSFKNDLNLTIDISLTKIIEKVLKTNLNKSIYSNLFVLLVDIRFGEILVITTVPNFNPNNLNTDQHIISVDRNLNQVFIPGASFDYLLNQDFIDASTFKITGYKIINFPIEVIPNSTIITADLYGNDYYEKLKRVFGKKSSKIKIFQDSGFLPNRHLTEKFDFSENWLGDMIICNSLQFATFYIHSVFGGEKELLLVSPNQKREVNKMFADPLIKENTILEIKSPTGISSNNFIALNFIINKTQTKSIADNSSMLDFSIGWFDSNKNKLLLAVGANRDNILNNDDVITSQIWANLESIIRTYHHDIQKKISPLIYRNKKVDVLKKRIDESNNLISDMQNSGE